MTLPLALRCPSLAPRVMRLEISDPDGHSTRCSAVASNPRSGLEGAPVAEIKTTCCIVGGGPAGLMLAFLLARAGVRLVVLEKHKDFLRDFRGDTVHPSTLEIMYELGLLKEFLELPHSTVREFSLQIGDEHLVLGNFEHPCIANSSR